MSESLSAELLALADGCWVSNTPLSNELLSAAERAITLEAELAEARAEVERLTREVREWQCDRCNWVYPGPPQKGVSCVICPRCGGNTAPAPVIERRRVCADRDRLREALDAVGARCAEESKNTTGIFTIASALEHNAINRERAAIAAILDAVGDGEPKTLTQKHIEHYRSCNCLGDSAVCCVASCECHGPTAAIV